jgi:hypothetical protein
MRDSIGRFLIRNLEDFYGGPLHRLLRTAEKQSKETLDFAAAAELGRNDGRKPPAAVPPQPRRTAAEERRRIDDMPIP